MTYLLDTNAVIGLMKGIPGLVARMRRHRPTDFGLSAVTVHELLFGAFKSQRWAQNVARVESLAFAVLPFDKRDGRELAEIRAALASVGTPIGPYDTLIAGQARARTLTLITRNTREFSRVRDLRVEDWES